MQRTSAIVLLAVAVLIVVGFMSRTPSGAAPATEAKKEERHINTSGSATIKVKPDSARVFFGVQTVQPTIKHARAENTEKVKKVMDALNGLKIKDLKMKSSDVNVEMLYSRPDHDQLPKVTGFRITHTFTVLVENDDAEKLGKTASLVLDTALENGVNSVQQIMFFKKDLTDIRRQAMTVAVEEAVANAKALASGIKAPLGGTISINGEPEYYSRAQQYSNSQVVGGDTELVVGNLDVTCRVSVTCTY